MSSAKIVRLINIKSIIVCKSKYYGIQKGYKKPKINNGLCNKP